MGRDRLAQPVHVLPNFIVTGDSCSVSSHGQSDREATDVKPDSPRAWLVVAAAFLASFVVFGVIYSFGVFLKPMAAEFGANAAAASAFFSITAAGFYASGAVTGRLADRFAPRRIIAAGAIALGAGLCLTALADGIWRCYLIYGIGVGIGGACCYLPPLAIIGRWFVRRRNMALGIAAAGTGCGTMAVPPIAAVLIQYYGWRMTNVIFGVAAMVVLLGCAVVTAAPPVARSSGDTALPLRAIFGSHTFVMLYLSWVLATTALFVPFVFLPAFARDHGASEVAAAALVSAIGGASILGRLVMGPVGDRLGVLPLFKMTVLMMAMSYAIWLLSSSYISLVIFAVVLGTAYGSRIAAVPGVLIEYFGLQNVGTVLGVFFTASGLSALLGPLLAGIAVDLTGSYSGGIVFALVTGLLGFVAIGWLRRPGEPPSGAADGAA
jgi:MFS family permease